MIALSSLLLVFSLCSAEVVSTDSTSRQQIKISDGTEVTLAPNTKVEVGEMLKLIVGKIRVLVKPITDKKEAEWKMKAGNAMMGVRGTEFIVDTTDKRTILCTFNGKVAVNGVEVGPNRGVVLAADGKMSPPVKMDNDQMQWWRQETTAQTTSYETNAMLLNDFWHWGGPTAVERLNPMVSYAENHTFNAGFDVWTRLLTASGDRTDLSFRGAVNAMLTPSPNHLVYGEFMGAAKTGDHNPQKSGFLLHELFWMGRTDGSNSLVIGRQEWNFGDGLMIGRNPWDPFTVYFDGALGTLRTENLRLRLFAATLDDRVGSTSFDDRLLGAYLDFANLPLETYLMNLGRRGENEQSTYALGERASLTIYKPFFATEEFVYERGRFRNLTQSAYLLYLDGGVNWHAGPFNGNAKLVLLRASGDNNPVDTTFGSFLPFFPDSHRFLGLVNVFPQIRNIQRFGPSLSARTSIFGRPLSFEASYSTFRRATTGDTAYPSLRSSTDLGLGHETDLIAWFEPHPKVGLQVGWGRFTPGGAFGSDTDSRYLAFITAQYKY